MRKEDKLNKYIEDIPNDKYHSDKEFLSSSQVKKAVESHANFRWLTMLKPDEERPWKADDAMNFGSLVHALAMEPHMIEKEFAFMDTEGRNMRLKDNQIYKKNFLHYNKAKIVLPQDSMARAEVCVEAMQGHTFLNSMLEAPGKVEMSGFYKDDFYGRLLRFRPDKLIPNYNGEGKDIILDIKTTRDIEGFIKDAKYKFHYDLSAYMYVDGHHKLSGNMADFYFGVVENAAPYRVAVFKASENFMLQGRKKYGRAMSNIDIAMGAKVSQIQWQMSDFEEI